VAFDLLCLGARDLRQEPFSARRALLEEAVAVAAPGLHRCPATEDPELARRWYHEFEGAGLDGLIAKPRAGRYEPDKRVQFKIKHRRSVDCVVAGYRTHKDGAGVGSMLLGLYDSAGVLHHLGVTASFSAKLRTQLAQDLAPLAEGALDDHPWAEWARPEAHETTRLPGAMSRWNGAKDLSWVPVRIERVVEVEYLTVTNGRFRGVTTFKRWRDDRDPTSCRFDQLVEVDPVGVSHVLQPTT
jgi:ATP-dependent DNA ligase